MPSGRFGGALITGLLSTMRSQPKKPIPRKALLVNTVRPANPGKTAKNRHFRRGRLAPMAGALTHELFIKGISVYGRQY